jgi:hypothetical protein
VSDEVKTTDPVETNAVDSTAVSDVVNQTNAAPLEEPDKMLTTGDINDDQ